MPTQQIEWADGSGDKIYITSPDFSGNQQIAVSSDPNTGAARSKVVTFSAGNVSKTLTVEQAAGSQEKTITKYLSSYDTNNSTYASITNEARAYGAINTSNWCANINLVTGSRAETFFYYKFDLSSIPVGATILSVSVQMRADISTTNTNYVATKNTAVCNGTTKVGSETALTGTATTHTLDAGSGWTRDSLQNLSVLLYAKRGTSRTTNAYSLRCYGAKIEITYTI